MKTSTVARGPLYIVIAALVLISLPVAGLLLSDGLTRADEVSNKEAEDLIKQGDQFRIEGNHAEEDGKHDVAISYYQDAILLYEEAKALDKSAFGYLDYLGLAGCYQKLGQYDEAIVSIEDGIDSMKKTGNDDEEFLLKISLADIYKEIKQFDKALEIYESQRARGQNSIDWYQGLAGIYEQMGNAENAKAIYKSAFDGLIFDEHLYSRCADFLIKNNYLDDAEAVTYKVIVAFQDEPYILPTAYRNLLTIYERQGRSSETLDWARLKLEEAEKRAEEFWEQPSPAEKEFSRALTWFIIIFSLAFVIVIIIIAFLIRRRIRKKKAGSDSQQAK